MKKQAEENLTVPALFWQRVVKHLWKFTSDIKFVLQFCWTSPLNSIYTTTQESTKMRSIWKPACV